MKLEEIINDKWLNSKNLNQQYIKNKPFPHIEIKDFLKEAHSPYFVAPDVKKLNVSVV